MCVRVFTWSFSSPPTPPPPKFIPNDSSCVFLLSPRVLWILLYSTCQHPHRHLIGVFPNHTVCSSPPSVPQQKQAEGTRRKIYLIIISSSVCHPPHHCSRSDSFGGRRVPFPNLQPSTPCVIIIFVLIHPLLLLLFFLLGLILLLHVVVVHKLLHSRILPYVLLLVLSSSD